MSRLTQKETELFAKRILNDYDAKNPSAIFKEKINISNADALNIQLEVSKLRERRGEEVIGYKIGCVSNETQKIMGFTQPAYGRLWNKELHTDGVNLNKRNYTNPAMKQNLE